MGGQAQVDQVETVQAKVLEVVGDLAGERLWIQARVPRAVRAAQRADLRGVPVGVLTHDVLAGEPPGAVADPRELEIVGQPERATWRIHHRGGGDQRGQARLKNNQVIGRLVARLGDCSGVAHPTRRCS